MAQLIEKEHLDDLNKGIYISTIGFPYGDNLGIPKDRIDYIVSVFDALENSSDRNIKANTMIKLNWYINSLVIKTDAYHKVCKGIMGDQFTHGHSSILEIFQSNFNAEDINIILNMLLTTSNARNDGIYPQDLTTLNFNIPFWHDYPGAVCGSNIFITDPNTMYKRIRVLSRMYR